MDSIKTIYIAVALAMGAPVAAYAQETGVTMENVSHTVANGNLNVSVDFHLNDIKLGKNHQIFITPVVRGGEEKEVVLPSILVNGRNMHFAYQRGALKGFDVMKNHDIIKEVRRENGKDQIVKYLSSTPLEKWMRLPNTRVAFVYDTCGCGVNPGSKIFDGPTIDINPVKEMRTAMITPKVTALPEEIHHGKARVQFEVDRTVLHEEPYTCKNGQKIDNRMQLKIIDDSVKYALSDPNVELAGISVCGYASPESPYLHNEYLATNRSKALAEYLARKYNLPQEKCTYSAVTENWKEFRDTVVKSNEITEKQRQDLLELIDRPAYGPSDFDAKERELETSPKFAKLYKTKIRPEWFPHLRATTFAITTRLKPMSDRQLAEVIETTPGKMSLNQMFRVARLYPEGSDEFNRIIKKALVQYPDDPTANLNAAAAAVARGEYKEAKEYLEKAGENSEVWNLKGIIATNEGEFEEAAKYFEKAGNLPEASKNLNLINNLLEEDEKDTSENTKTK